MTVRPSTSGAHSGPATRAATLILALALAATLTLAAGCTTGRGSMSTGVPGTTASEAGDTQTVPTVPGGVGGTTAETGAPGGDTTATTASEQTVPYEQILPDLEDKARDAPADLVALQELAIAYYQTGRYAEAEATYLRMLALADTAATHNNLGNVYRDWGRTDTAVTEYQRAIEIAPQTATSYANLAALYLTQGRDAEAVALLERGIARTAGTEREKLEALHREITRN